MRIIGGQFKGRKLDTMADKSIRPTTDRVKESMMNLIQNDIVGASVLDLFAGSGALGIETLSRGAETCTFVDNSRTSIVVLEKNLAKISAKYDIISKDYRSALDELGRRGKKFDIIFLDPPYGKDTESDALLRIKDHNLLTEDGLIMIERDRDDNPHSLPHGFIIADARHYGGTTVEIIRIGTKCAITGTFDPFTKGHRQLVDVALETFDMAHIVILDNPEKTSAFRLMSREKIIEQSTKDISHRVKIEYFSGMTIDYCKKNGIINIIRGVRNEKDADYEKEMADYNEQNGGIETTLVQSSCQEISSTLVKEKIMSNEDITELMVHSALKEVQKEARRWKM
ncbi:MAG: 16S rRNA (guanine(966)-N(2))-methyltransferase RsmD [Bacillota bacterium]